MGLENSLGLYSCLHTAMTFYSYHTRSTSHYKLQYDSKMDHYCDVKEENCKCLTDILSGILSIHEVSIDSFFCLFHQLYVIASSFLSTPSSLAMSFCDCFEFDSTIFCKYSVFVIVSLSLPSSSSRSKFPLGYSQTTDVLCV
uniref:Ovule protein n=1 Tax=Strongyloides venezuelensis TaxID=75913 RepID=A0A0K0G1C2_STRVS